MFAYRGIRFFATDRVFLEGPNWLIVREMRLQRATRNWWWGMSHGKKVNRGFEGQ